MSMDWCSYYLAWTSVPSVSNQLYEPTMPAVAFTFSDATFTPANCTSTLQYTATLSNGTALPSYITFTAANRSFSVYSSDVYLEEYLTVKVTVKLSGDFYYQNTTSFTFDINITSNIDPCTYLLQWTSLPTIGTKTYWAGDTQVDFTFPNVTWSPTTGCASDIMGYSTVRCKTIAVRCLRS